MILNPVGTPQNIKDLKLEKKMENKSLENKNSDPQLDAEIKSVIDILKKKESFDSGIQ